MNNEILQEYNLEITRNNRNKCSISGHWLSSYVYTFREKGDVEDFIADLNLAIAGNYDLIEDPDYTSSLGPREGLTFSAFITPTAFEIIGAGLPPEHKMEIPHEDMKEILLSWFECLNA